MPGAVCRACLEGHRTHCERPLSCHCICRTQPVAFSEYIVLEQRWRRKLADWIETCAAERARAEMKIVPRAKAAAGGA